MAAIGRRNRGHGRSHKGTKPGPKRRHGPAYVFLASPVTASYVNGIVLPVMGGPRG